MIPIHVVGIGLDGVTGLTQVVRQMVDRAALLVGSPRHLSYFPDHAGDRLPVGDLTAAIQHILAFQSQKQSDPSASIVILTSGDPLFFGLGRLLLNELPAEQLSFHPHLSSVQLAFSRVKLPWQDAKVISAHGRSLEELTQAVQQGTEKIAVLTDQQNTPGAIVRLLQSLDLPSHYQIWVCENLGGAEERIVELEEGKALSEEPFAPLNVVVLQRRMGIDVPIDRANLPQLGIPDGYFLSFPDRPGLMTKREVRVQILAELALQPGQMVWDVGAGTGSVAIEIARLCPGSTIYAIEKTAIGVSLIRQNCQRFQINSVIPVQGSAPEALLNLPKPDRIFIGGSGGNLLGILNRCREQLAAKGRMVLALATLEHLSQTIVWLEQHALTYQVLQVQLSRSVPIASLTRLSPLNPVTLVTIDLEK